MIGSRKPEQQPENQATFTSKTQKIMVFPPTATFGQLFPFKTSFEAKLFSSPETVVIWLTQQQKAKIKIMRTKATGLCAKSRRAVEIQNSKF